MRASNRATILVRVTLVAAAITAAPACQILSGLSGLHEGGAGGGGGTTSSTSTHVPSTVTVTSGTATTSTGQTTTSGTGTSSGCVGSPCIVGTPDQKPLALAVNSKFVDWTGTLQGKAGGGWINLVNGGNQSVDALGVGLALFDDNTVYWTRADTSGVRAYKCNPAALNVCVPVGTLFNAGTLQDIGGIAVTSMSGRALFTGNPGNGWHMYWVNGAVDPMYAVSMQPLPPEIAANADHGFWLASARTRIHAALPDDMGVDVVIVGGGDTATHIAVDPGLSAAGGYVYWTTQSTVGLWRAKSDGSSSPELFMNAHMSDPGALLSDGQHVYWLEKDTSICEGSGSLKRFSTDPTMGNAPEVLVSGLVCPRALAQDALHVYFSTGADNMSPQPTVRRVDKK